MFHICDRNYKQKEEDWLGSLHFFIFIFSFHVTLPRFLRRFCSVCQTEDNDLFGCTVLCVRTQVVLHGQISYFFRV